MMSRRQSYMRPTLETVLDFVIQDNTAEANDKAFVGEFKVGARFTGAGAVRLGDGLFSTSSGSLEAPASLGGLMFGFATARSHAAR